MFIWANDYLSPFGVLWVHMAWHKNCIKNNALYKPIIDERPKFNKVNILNAIQCSADHELQNRLYIAALKLNIEI